MPSSDVTNVEESHLTPIRPEESKHFKQFQVTKTGISNLHITGPEPENKEFLVETSLYHPAKPDITLHSGASSKGKVLGSVDLKKFSGHYTITLSSYPSEDEDTVEEFDRVKGWSSRHEFQFIFGKREKRQTFVWRHRGERLSENRDDLELVVDNEDDEEEEVLAQYVKESGGWKSKGVLVVREGGGESWEKMVVLTLMALVVSKRREQ